MNLKLYLIFFLFIPCASFASDSLQLLKSIPIKSTLFTTDPTGNIYVVNQENALIRYSSTGDSNAVFQEIKKGHITQIDATNPMRILVFFADFGQIVILDKQLSVKSVLKLPALGFLNVPCIANSADGGIWLFDPILGNLIKINEKPEILLTTSIRNILDKPLNPLFMVEQDRSLFVVDSIEGVKRFDLYGFFQSALDVKTTEVQFINAFLIYFKAPYLFSYHTLSFTEKTMKVPSSETALQVRIERNKLFIRRPDRLDLYSMTAK